VAFEQAEVQRKESERQNAEDEEQLRLATREIRERLKKEAGRSARDEREKLAASNCPPNPTSQRSPQSLHLLYDFYQQDTTKKDITLAFLSLDSNGDGKLEKAELGVGMDAMVK